MKERGLETLASTCACWLCFHAVFSEVEVDGVTQWAEIYAADGGSMATTTVDSDGVCATVVGKVCVCIVGGFYTGSFAVCPARFYGRNEV
jgi:hypothetical protein